MSFCKTDNILRFRAITQKEVSPSHAKRLAWLNLKIMRLSPCGCLKIIVKLSTTGSHRCPATTSCRVSPMSTTMIRAKQMSTTMIRAKHAIRLSDGVPHPRRPPWRAWNCHLETNPIFWSFSWGLYVLTGDHGMEVTIIVVQINQLKIKLAPQFLLVSDWWNWNLKI